MSVDLSRLLADLVAETDDLLRLLDGVTDWDAPSAAAGWSLRDQIVHLATIDEAAIVAATDPDRFAAEYVVLGDDAPDLLVARHRGGPVPVAWFRAVRRDYVELCGRLDPKSRIAWFGPPMSVASSVTARLMETWAHGQDVADALGVRREPTARLKHVADLGVRTLRWSFRQHGLPEPSAPVRVQLRAPDGSDWTWGPDDAPDRVAGPALDFCLVVTRRRNHHYTHVDAVGPVAEAWLSVAQAYAGRP